MIHVARKAPKPPHADAGPVSPPHQRVAPRTDSFATALALSLAMKG